MRRTGIVMVLGLMGAMADLPLFAQCSDAGACVVGSAEQSESHRIGVFYVYGRSTATDDLTFNGVQLDAVFRLSPHTNLQVRLPFTHISGPLGSTRGIGDAVVTAEQTINKTHRTRFAIQAGARLSIGEENAAGLPQSYQPGLGTTDLIVGISYENHEWMTALAYQLSRSRNTNALTRLKRGDDIMLRGGYRSSIERLRFSGELLAVQRLTKSSVLVGGASGSEVYTDLENSNALQVNVVGEVVYPLAGKLDVSLSAAVPLLKREVNVDGLTRALSAKVGVIVAL